MKFWNVFLEHVFASILLKFPWIKWPDDYVVERNRGGIKAVVDSHIINPIYTFTFKTRQLIGIPLT